MKHILLMAFAAFTLIGADATGTWTGTLTISASGGEEQTRPAHIMLKQDGASLTGTAGPTADEQHPIEKGRADGGNLTFEVPTGETTMKFTLRQDGDELKGQVTREHEGETQTAKLTAKREPNKP